MKVLLAEDDPISRHLLRVSLEKWGHQVTAAADGAAAWRLFSEGEFPLVLSDWMMPEMDGPELIRRIRACQRPGYVFIILLTARTQREDLLAGLAAGADDFMTKPVDQDELRVRLQAAERVLRLETALLRQNQLLAEKNAQYEADLQLACETQRALLPRRYPTFPRTKPAAESTLRFCHRFQPNAAVGGDFFDVLRLSDTLAGVFLGDVMGHGVRAALVAALTRGLTEKRKPAAGDPGRFLSELNGDLLAILESMNMPMFVSACYLVADTATGEVRYANAGHPSPLHLRRAVGQVVPLPAAGGKTWPPLGVREGTTYAVGQVTVDVGDAVVFFTDGLSDALAVGAPSNEEEVLVAAVQKRVHLPLGELFDNLLHEIQESAAGAPLPDDVCMIGMELASRDGTESR